MGDEDTGITPQEGETPAESPPATDAGVVETPDTDATTPKGGVQERIDKLTAEKYEARREAAYWRGKAESAPAAPAPATPAVEEPLDPNDFDTDAEYRQALEERITRKVIAKAEAGRAKSAEDERRATMVKAATEGRKAHKDFDSVALDPTVPVTPTMFEAAVGDSLGEVLYWLGSNRGEASRIAGLSTTLQIKEIGKIEARLSAGITPKTTNAPTPPTTVKGGATTTKPKDQSKMNRAELRAEWDKERRQRLGV